MQLFNGLPIFVVDINDDSVFNNISIVDRPAIERNFIQLAKQAEIDFKFSVNDEKRTISGPALIPDLPIYRRMDDGKEFYIKFTADTIKEYAIKFFKDKREGEGNIQHSWGVKGITFFESYLLNKERGIVPVEFKDLPNGTWILSAKVENDGVWSMIKDGSLQGFSVDIQTTIKESEDVLDSLEDLMEYLNKN